MKIIKLALPAMVLHTGFVLTSSVGMAKPEYTKKEKKACVTCHVTAKSKELNEVGKYYHEKKTLEGAPKPEKKEKD